MNNGKLKLENYQFSTVNYQLSILNYEHNSTTAKN